jgi:hypothetical protein
VNTASHPQEILLQATGILIQTIAKLKPEYCILKIDDIHGMLTLEIAHLPEFLHYLSCKSQRAG